MKAVVLVACCVAAMAPAIAGGPVNQARPAPAPKGREWTQSRERYVKLVLAMGQHDADYVDAYYGPAEWKKEAETRRSSISTRSNRARALIQELDRLAKRDLRAPIGRR